MQQERATSRQQCYCIGMWECAVASVSPLCCCVIMSIWRLHSICMCVCVCWPGAFARLLAMLLPHCLVSLLDCLAICVLSACCCVSAIPRHVSLRAPSPFRSRHLRIEPVNCLLVLTAIWIRPWKVAIKISNFIFMPWLHGAICMLQARFYPPHFYFGSRNFHLTQAS